MVGQVKVIAILMMVQGGLSLVMSLFLMFFGPFMFAMMKMDKNVTSEDEVIMSLVGGLYVVLGIGMLIVAILNIVGGIRAHKFRSRIFCIVALFSNLASFMACYCAPTGIALMTYGLVVLFNPEVAEAFRKAEPGPADFS